MAGALGMMKKGGFWKDVLPVLASIFLPGAGSAIGTALGASGTTASVIGNAIIGGGVGALSGGGGKGAMRGAVMGGGSAAVAPMFGMGAPADAAPAGGALTTQAAAPAAPSGGGMGNMTKLAMLAAMAGGGGGNEYEQGIQPELPDSFTRPNPEISFDREYVGPTDANAYYTYGEAPTFSEFFKNNSVSEVEPPSSDWKRGGKTPPMPRGALSKDSMYVRGPGSGRDDVINAKLSNNEFVIDAETVALLGDGSPDDGARKLEELRASIRKHKGKALAKGKFSPDAKPAAAYLKKGK